MLWTAALPGGVAVYREQSWQRGMSVLSLLKPSDLCQGSGLDFYYLSLLSLLCERKKGHRGVPGYFGTVTSAAGGTVQLVTSRCH